MISNPKIPAFDLQLPVSGVAAIPLVVDSPHSGSIIPDDFRFVCSLADLRQSEDSHVDLFASHVPATGGTLLRALINRAYIDLNRALGDLHPSICSDPVPWPLHPTARSRHGIGLIRHLINSQTPVYDAPLSLAAITHRVDTVYRPYYAALEQALKTTHAEHGRVLHMNLHATPGMAFDHTAPADIILGDHDGHSCGRAYREWLRQFFTRHGLTVMINSPYKGVELTKVFAKPRQGFHSIQIEVNKGLYMDENTLALHDGATALQDLFNHLWDELGDFLGAQNTIPHAAE